MCGLRHSTFRTTPVTDTGLVRSYSVENEWWAATGAPARSTSHAAPAACSIFIGRSPSMGAKLHPRIGHVNGRIREPGWMCRQKGVGLPGLGPRADDRAAVGMGLLVDVLHMHQVHVAFVAGVLAIVV